MNNKWLKLYNEWLKGNLSQDDQHRMEREALDDPFLGDALEGIELHHDGDRSLIQDRLEQRLKSNKRPKVFKLWKYAAAASIVLIAGAFFFLRPDQELLLERELHDHEAAISNVDHEIISHEGVSNLISYDPDENGDARRDRTTTTSANSKLKSEEIHTTETAKITHQSTPESNSGVGLSPKLNGREIAFLEESDEPIDLTTYVINSEELSDEVFVSNTALKRNAPVNIPQVKATSTDPMPVDVPELDLSYISNVQHSQRAVAESLIDKSAYDTVFDQINVSDQLITIKGNPIGLALANQLQNGNPFLTSDLTSLGQMLSSSDTRSDTIFDYQRLYNLLDQQATPLVGWTAFDSIFQNSINDLDMNIESKGTLLITFDAVGNIQQWSAGGLPDSIVNTLLYKVGPWNIGSKFPMVIYPYDLSLNSIDTIKPNLEGIGFDKFGDKREFKPLIGWEAFDSILMTEMPDKEYMFMRGIKDGTPNRLSLSIDSLGRVFQFNSGSMPTDHIERVIDKTGKWDTNKESAIIIHKHKIVSKKE